MSHESERVWDLFVITVGIFFLLLLAWTPLVLSFTFPKLKLAPGSQAGPVFMSLRLGQYFSVEPDRRDPLYKTLTKNRQPPCPQARGPPAPCVERSPPGRPAGPTAPRAPPGPRTPQTPRAVSVPQAVSAPWAVSAPRAPPAASHPALPPARWLLSSQPPPRPRDVPGRRGTPRAPFRSSRCPALLRRSSRRGIPNPDPKPPLACWVSRL